MHNVVAKPMHYSLCNMHYISLRPTSVPVQSPCIMRFMHDYIMRYENINCTLARSLHWTIHSTLPPFLDRFPSILLHSMESTYLYLLLLSDYEHTVSFLSYSWIITFFGTLGSRCSLVHATASVAIWTISSTKELYFPLYHALISIVHQANTVLWTLGEWL